MTVKRTYEKDGLTFISKSTEKAHFIKLDSKSRYLTSKLFSFDKSVKYKEMTPDMLELYERIRSDMQELTSCRDKYDLDISVSDVIQVRYMKI
ncbi:hypothetical protein [Staphylococcus equorum]|uniref:hypothetical protein n=1 Tax=Staphylococcus equorum TaxID=246432 RepID=UPI003EBD2453